MLSFSRFRASAIQQLRPAAIGAIRTHCQVPCGIFDDPARVELLKEDAATVRKAMVQIGELSGTGTPLALNQVRCVCRPLRFFAWYPTCPFVTTVVLSLSLQAVRWINTKEDHAQSIISTVAEYMLAQRVKKELFENNADYLQALAAHHALMQAAVKTKQVADVAVCDALDHAIADVGAMYTKQ